MQYDPRERFPLHGCDLGRDHQYRIRFTREHGGPGGKYEGQLRGYCMNQAAALDDVHWCAAQGIDVLHEPNPHFVGKANLKEVK